MFLRSRPLAYAAASASLLSAALVAGVVLVAPGVVRKNVVARAAARGVSLTIGRVELGWLTVRLRDVGVHIEHVDDLAGQFALVQVSLDARLRPLRVEASGGRVSADAGGTLRSDLERWRSASAGTSAASERSSLVLLADIDEARIANGPHSQATLTNIHVERQGAETNLKVAAADARWNTLGVQAADVRFAFDANSGALQESRALSVDIVWAAQSSPETSAEEPAPPPVIPPLPTPEPPAARRPRKNTPSHPGSPTEIPSFLPDLHTARALLDVELARSATFLPVLSAFHVDALSVRILRGTEELSVASGLFDFERGADGLKVRFSTPPLARTTPLSLSADLPYGAHDAEIAVAGGPVPLGLLGLKDGGLLHLLNADHASVAGKGRIVLEGHGDALTFDVEGSVHNLSFREPRIALDPIYGLDLGFATRGVLDDKGYLRLDDAAGTVGLARANLRGGVTQTSEHVAIQLEFDFPTTSCQSLLTSVPSALLPTVSAARMDGTFGLHGTLAVDSKNLDAAAFDYEVSDRCRLVNVPPDLDRARFTREFTHTVYSKTGDPVETTTGPGSPNWAELDEISPYMQVAVLTTEDGAFYHHHGFSHGAIRHAVLANIKAGRFVRGASTITMQLAKNLFLTRQKTLARKLEELVLADYLEQAFTKDEMMELYLNIIEFGPDLYGVGAAADHYFGRKPSELNLAECMFLSSILPNPVVFGKVYQDGRLGDGWLRTLRARMEVARRNGLISAAELAEGQAESVVFHAQDAPPPPPRPSAAVRDRAGSATDWEELN